MTVLVFSCPVHGTLVEFDSPGPKSPPETCWKPVARRFGVFICPPPTCRERLVVTHEEL